MWGPGAGPRFWGAATTRCRRTSIPGSGRGLWGPSGEGSAGRGAVTLHGLGHGWSCRGVAQGAGRVGGPVPGCVGGGERPVLPLPGGTPPSDTTRPPWPCRWSLGDGGELRGPHLRQRLPPAAGEPAAAPGGDECLGTPPTATHLPWQPPGEREAPQVRVGRFRSGDGQQRPLASHPFGFREQLLP